MYLVWWSYINYFAFFLLFCYCFEFLFVCLFVFCFLGLCPWHMEVPRLGVESELQLLAYTTVTATWDLSCICDLYHSSWQCRILNLSEARGQIHNLMVPTRICFRCTMMGTQRIFKIYSVYKTFVRFATIFFQSVACLLILLTVFLIGQKFLILKESD